MQYPWQNPVLQVFQPGVLLGAMAGSELRRSKAAARTWREIQPDDGDPAAPVFEMTGEDLGAPSTRSSPSMSAPSSDNRDLGGSPRLMPAPEVVEEERSAPSWAHYLGALHSAFSGPDPGGGPGRQFPENQTEKDGSVADRQELLGIQPSRMRFKAPGISRLIWTPPYGKESVRPVLPSGRVLLTGGSTHWQEAVAPAPDGGHHLIENRSVGGGMPSGNSDEVRIAAGRAHRRLGPR